MTKKTEAILCVLVVGVVAGLIFAYAYNQPQTGNNGSQVSTDNLTVEETIPTVQAVENSFGILTPEQKAAREEAARVTAEAALQASSTATSTASSSIETEVETN